MSVELKILVPLEEWKLLKSKAKTHENCDDTSKELERLREIEKEHQKCSAKVKSLSTTEGAGAEVNETGDHKISDVTFVMPNSNHNRQQNIDASADIIDKNIIVDKAIEVPSDSNPVKILSDSEILQHIKDKFRNHASALLGKLAGHSSKFSYDSNGILSIFGKKYPGNKYILFFPKTLRFL